MLLESNVLAAEVHICEQFKYNFDQRQQRQKVFSNIHFQIRARPETAA